MSGIKLLPPQYIVAFFKYLFLGQNVSDTFSDSVVGSQLIP